MGEGDEIARLRAELMKAQVVRDLLGEAVVAMKPVVDAAILFEDQIECVANPFDREVLAVRAAVLAYRESHPTAVCTCERPQPDEQSKCGSCRRPVLARVWHEGRPTNKEPQP